MQVHEATKARSSSREVRIRAAPFFLWSVLVGEPSPQKVGERHLAGGPRLPSSISGKVVALA